MCFHYDSDTDVCIITPPRLLIVVWAEREETVSEVEQKALERVNKDFLSSLGDPTDTDYTAVGCAITTISSNLTEMSKGVKLLAALIEDDTGGSNDLMGAARNLAGAVSDLLKAVEPASGEVRRGWRRQMPQHWSRRA